MPVHFNDLVEVFENCDASDEDGSRVAFPCVLTRWLTMGQRATECHSLCGREVA